LVCYGLPRHPGYGLAIRCRTKGEDAITHLHDHVAANAGEGESLTPNQASNPKRVLVLGASGFIGEHLVAALAASKWAVPVASSRRGTTRCTEPVETLRLDVRDATAIRDAVRSVDAVVNCVAGDNESIVSGAQVLFESCAQLTPRPRIVHMSTISVYGSATGTADETSPLLADGDGYGAAKVKAESLARGYRSVVFLRPGIVYGPGSSTWTERIGRLLLAHRLGDLGVAGEGYCNLVHVDDVVAATLLALRRTELDGEAFNLSLPVTPSWNDYFRRFAGALATSSVPISRTRLRMEQLVVAPPVKVAEILAQARGMKWRPPMPISPSLVRLFGQPLRMDVSKAERVLGMKWKPLDDGLRESAAWLRGSRPAEPHESPAT
jgi:2-alkyl-3-oxoalkanoate reductase